MNRIKEEAEKRYPTLEHIISLSNDMRRIQQRVFISGAEFGQSIEQERAKVLVDMLRTLADNFFIEIEGEGKKVYSQIKAALKTYNHE